MSLLDSIRGLFTRKPKTYIDQQDHPQVADSDKRAHRWAAEKSIGRKLRAGEVIHHKNRDRSDNRAENISVLGSQEEHDRVHERDAKRQAKKNGH